MSTPHRTGKRRASAVSATLLVLLSMVISTSFVCPQPVSSTEQDETQALMRRLETGEIVVKSEDISGTKYVVARILIDERADRLWPILVNPFEFERRICHRMKDVKVLTDQRNISVLDYKVGVVFPIPDLDYIVESHYNAPSRIEFKRVSGSFKDFRGFWELQPQDQGAKTEVTYSMYLDTGFPVPDWIVRQGVRSELPNVLSGLRERINELKHNGTAPTKHSIVAASLGSSV